MRILGLFFLLLSLVKGAGAQVITFAETSHDFGVIREADGTVFHDFYFMNTGDAPLRIQSVLTSCGCTSSEWAKEPLNPGEKARIRVCYHPQGRNEKSFTNIAEVYTNSKNFGTHKGVHNLYVSGEVVREKKIVKPVYLLHRKDADIGERREKTNVFSLILQRMQDEMREGRNIHRDDSLTLFFVSSLKQGGSWPDIDYTCYFRTNWQPVEHLQRVMVLACSHADPKSGFYGDSGLYEAIRDALSFWTNASPKSHNWWFNQIAVPQHLGNILVCMEAGKKRLPDRLQQEIYGMMSWPDPRKWTGANKLDIALHHLQRGCLLKNDSIVKAAAEQIFYPVRITTAEGIQPDLSYHQHDNQLYIGAYGTVFSEGITKIAYWLRETPYALDGEKLKLFSSFIRETYLNVFRGAYADFSVLGRGISRMDALDRSSTAGMVKKLESLDTAHARVYADAAVRFAESGKAGHARIARNAIYWRSDYALHNREKFDFSVRTASVRTRKTESGNGENLCGGFLADGATSIRVNGNEYYNIFPVWDWNKIPGVTALEKSTAIGVNWGEMGKAVFSGGVSDGLSGAMAFAMADQGLEAWKSWFFFDKEVVCLGAGITSTSDDKVVTCVNQCLLDGEVLTDGGVLKGEAQTKETTVEWILHDSVLYAFPSKARVGLYAGKQVGNWNKINYNYSASRVEKDVFKLWIDHGRGVGNAGYAYIVVPGVTGIEGFVPGDVEIYSNTKEIQAVYHRKEDLLMVFFYREGCFKAGACELIVDRPCAVMVKNAGKNPEVLLAAPTQLEKKISWRYANEIGKWSGKAVMDRGKTVKAT